MKKSMTIGLIMFMIAASASAKELTLEEAVEMGIKNNYQVKKDEKNLENVKIQVKEAYKLGMPKLSYSGTFTRMEEYKNSNGNLVDSNYSNQIILQQPLFAGGQVITGIKVASIGEEQSKYSLQNTKNSVRLEVIEAYGSIIKLQKNLEVTERALNELNKNYEVMSEKYQLKMVTKNVLLEMEYSISDLESTIIQIKNGIEISKIDLKNKIGMNQDEPIELKEFQDNSPKASEINLSEDIAYAKENNLNIKIVKIGTRLKEASEVMDRAALLPQVNFQFNYGKEDPELSKSMDIGEWNWGATVAVNYDIWYWGKNKNKYERAKNETVKVKEDEKNYLNNIELSVRNGYLEILRIEQTIAAKEKLVASAKENFEIERERMVNALITSTDFLQAENRYRKAEIDYNNMKIDYYVTYEKYLDSLGRGRK